MRLAPRRKGVSLLEVIIASAVMFIALAAINELLISGAEQAATIREQSEAVQVCQSKMNEFSCGALGFNSQGGECEELPGWEWSVEASQFEVQGLWQVHVRVSKIRSNYNEYVAMSQMVLDPTKRGSAADEPPLPGMTTTPDMPDEPAPANPMTPTTPTTPMTQPMTQPMTVPLPMGGGQPRGMN